MKSNYEQREDIANRILKELDYGNTTEEFKFTFDINWEFAWDNSHPAFIIDLSQFLNYKEDIRNFVYDRKLGMVFCNFGCGHHHWFMQTLEELYQHTTEDAARDQFHIDKKNGMTGCWEDFATQYLLNHRGFFLSSISDSITKSEFFVLNSQERIIFKSYNFSDM